MRARALDGDQVIRCLPTCRRCANTWCALIRDNTVTHAAALGMRLRMGVSSRARCASLRHEEVDGALAIHLCLRDTAQRGVHLGVVGAHARAEEAGTEDGDRAAVLQALRHRLQGSTQHSCRTPWMRHNTLPVLLLDNRRVCTCCRSGAGVINSDPHTRSPNGKEGSLEESTNTARHKHRCYSGHHVGLGSAGLTVRDHGRTRIRTNAHSNCTRAWAA